MYIYRAQHSLDSKRSSHTQDKRILVSLETRENSSRLPHLQPPREVWYQAMCARYISTLSSLCHWDPTASRTLVISFTATISKMFSSTQTYLVRVIKEKALQNYTCNIYIYIYKAIAFSYCKDPWETEQLNIEPGWRIAEHTQPTFWLPNPQLCSPLQICDVTAKNDAFLWNNKTCF